MATNKRLADLTSYASVLPYASEMFGVYQPLLGWRSQRTEERFEEGFEKDKRQLLVKVKKEFTGQLDVTYKNNTAEVALKPGVLEGKTLRAFDSVVLESIAKKLPAEGGASASAWTQAITKSAVEGILKNDVAKTYAKEFAT